MPSRLLTVPDDGVQLQFGWAGSKVEQLKVTFASVTGAPDIKETLTMRTIVSGLVLQSDLLTIVSDAGDIAVSISDSYTWNISVQFDSLLYMSSVSFAPDMSIHAL